MDIQIDVTNVKIETPRLILRYWKESDLDDFYEYAQVKEIGEMAGWKYHESIEESKQILEQFMLDKNILAIELKSNGKVIGSVGFHFSWANKDEKLKSLKVKELGYVLSKDYWGNGYMPEAVNATIKYCFEVLELDALTVGHFLNNMQSKRVIEKCGFEYVKQGEFFSPSLNKTFAEKSYILYRK